MAAHTAKTMSAIGWENWKNIPRLRLTLYQWVRRPQLLVPVSPRRTLCKNQIAHWTAPRPPRVPHPVPLGSPRPTPSAPPIDRFPPVPPGPVKLGVNNNKASSGRLKDHPGGPPWRSIATMPHCDLARRDNPARLGETARLSAGRGCRDAAIGTRICRAGQVLAPWSVG